MLLRFVCWFWHSHNQLPECGQIGVAILFGVQQRCRTVLLGLRVPGEDLCVWRSGNKMYVSHSSNNPNPPPHYLRTVAGQQFNFGHLQRRQTLQKMILLVARLERHQRIRPAEKERHGNRKTSHIHRILAIADPAVIEPGQFAVAHHRTAHAELRHQTDRPHGHLARVAHLLEDRQIVRVVVVRKVEDALRSVGAQPRQSTVAIGDAARFRLVLLVLGRHRGDQVHERHADALQLARDQRIGRRRVLDDQPEQVGHMLQRVAEPRDLGHLLGALVRGRYDVQRRRRRLCKR